MAARPYNEVPLRAVNVQHNRDRFQGQWDRSYLISRWRGNLKHNLYFVCCRARIQVYRPAFPDQTLPLRPSLVIEPPVSSDDLSGYIDQSVPHSINRILVDFLGNQEVLLIACDDGDVIGFYTDSIDRVVSRRTEQESSGNIIKDEVRPFFHVNVGKSAWGLAIHQEARKIAVSCNTQRVTVFAFALVANDRRMDKGTSDIEDTTMLEPADRAEDQVIELPEADHNIPNVSFCNTGDDVQGRFLLATDIVGNMIMYDIDQRSIVRSIRCAYCKTGAAADHRCLCSDKSHYPHALWGAFWLDRRSFSRQQDVRATTGLNDLASSQLSKSWALDISRSRHDVPNSSLEYVPGQGTAESGILDNDDDDEEQADYMDEDVSVEEDTGLLDSSDEDSLPNLSPPTQSQASPFEQPQPDTDPPPTGGQADASPLGTPNLTLMQQLEAATTPSLSSALWTGFLHPPPALRADILAITRRPKRLHYITKTTHTSDTSPSSPVCPILQLSIKDITLFQPHVPHEQSSSGNGNDSNPHSGASLPPAVFLHDVLWQRIPATVDNPFYNSIHLDRMARFSLVAHIPSLGLVLAGSPAGRVAVLSLAQTQVALPRRPAAATSPRPQPSSSPSTSSSSSPVSSSTQKPRGANAGRAPVVAAVRNFYSVRVDHILPLRSQEQAGDRPERLLLGLAVSPVQGQLGRTRPSDAGRWRVLLMYEDQSVLSYEVSRPRAGGAGGRLGGSWRAASRSEVFIV